MAKFKSPSKLTIPTPIPTPIPMSEGPDVEAKLKDVQNELKATREALKISDRALLTINAQFKALEEVRAAEHAHADVIISRLQAKLEAKSDIDELTSARAQVAELTRQLRRHHGFKP